MPINCITPMLIINLWLGFSQRGYNSGKGCVRVGNRRVRGILIECKFLGLAGLNAVTYFKHNFGHPVDLIEFI